MAKKNMMEWWPHRNEEERNEVREALRKHGPSSMNYDDVRVLLLLNCELVRQALLERYRVRGTATPLRLARNLRKFLTTGIAC
jgi:hypothetical protein